MGFLINDSFRLCDVRMAFVHLVRYFSSRQSHPAKRKHATRLGAIYKLGNNAWNEKLLRPSFRIAAAGVMSDLFRMTSLSNNNINHNFFFRINTVIE